MELRPNMRRQFSLIRDISQLLGLPVGILVDLAGPKIRLGQLAQDPLECQVGGRLDFVRGDSSSHATELVSTYPPLVDELNVE